uniref:Putative secreted protein n=1 Tax=Nyssomyia neivai TaxID=330878 RepID=A0A1L8DNV4_9DIPT
MHAPKCHNVSTLARVLSRKRCLVLMLVLRYSLLLRTILRCHILYRRWIKLVLRNFQLVPWRTGAWSRTANLHCI